MKHTCRKKWVTRIAQTRGFWFHIAGLACLIWFLIRVCPAPHRSQYPCQQVAIPIALGYIAFWSLTFHGLVVWIRRVKFKTAAIVPTLLVVFLLLFSIGGIVFATNYFTGDTLAAPWTPVPENPIGTPQGLHPGRVVWIWDPDATEQELSGYWWQKENNNQAVLDNMLSQGIQGLAGTADDTTAWDQLFTYFNEAHGFGTVGYQPGEKIAIKINLNNCWDYRWPSYLKRDNERDANPYVVKALLKQLIDTAGVDPDDITVYDASRSMGNWFYNRVYYETYPALAPVPEFPEVHFVDAEGGASGREKVEASTQRIYFADATGLYRTLPTCVVDAKYLINMPLLKKHPIENGVTLSGKNLFGTFIEPVVDLHPYHEAAHILGNPAPQVDLLAHEHIGGKTLLYIGDGTYGTRIDHRTLGKFQMYPFNDDWTNSLFFSQDPVAIDSVMYDFLHAEGTNPCEGSQNYLHQAAAPSPGVYDPEHDGSYLNVSLGVHEHWNTSVDIFSSERYSGPSSTGIDFLAFGGEDASPTVLITTPQEHALYRYGQFRRSLPITVIIGYLEVEAQVNGVSDTVDYVEFYLDGEVQHTDYERPYKWVWNEPAYRKHTLHVIAYSATETYTSDDIVVWKFF